MTIAYKEARETLYWLRLLKEAGFVKPDFNECLRDVEELNRILSSITKTTKSQKGS
jgi:four helix bundle protein